MGKVLLLDFLLGCLAIIGGTLILRSWEVQMASVSVHLGVGRPFGALSAEATSTELATETRAYGTRPGSVFVDLG